MSLKLNFALITGAAGVLLLSGCKNLYEAPPSDFESSSFTQRKTSGADRLLDAVSELTLPQAQAIALKNNPNYRSAAFAVKAAAMRYYQAMGAFSPTLSASFEIGDVYATNKHQVNSVSPDRINSFSTSTGVQAQWLLFSGFARYFQLKAMESSEMAQRQLEADDCRKLMRNVAYAYNEILLQKENMRIAIEDMKFQRSSLQDTEIKHKAGAVPLSDVLNFRIYVNTAEGSWITAQYNLEVAVYALAVMMGYPEGTLPAHIKFPAINTELFSELPSIDVYLDAALQNRPDLKAVREQLKYYEYQLKQTYSAFSPTVTAYANLGYDTGLTRYYGERSYAHSYSDQLNLSYGLQANWQLFNGLIRYNQTREAIANLAQAHYSVADQWLSVVSEVRNAYANYNQSVRQTALYQKTRELTAKQRDLVDEEYRAGNKELTRLNEAQRDLVDAETKLASSLINVHNAKAQLEATAAFYDAAFYSNANRADSAPVPDALKTPDVPNNSPNEILRENRTPLQSAPAAQQAPAAQKTPAAQQAPAVKK